MRAPALKSSSAFFGLVQQLEHTFSESGGLFADVQA